MIIIGDVHGCYDTLVALVAKLPKDQKIVFCGDLIDRGPKSKQVIDFVKDNGHLCVKGNHEDMMVSYLNKEPQSGHWLNNGGMEALQSFGDPDQVADNFPKEYQEWIDKLPYFLHFPDVVNSDGRALYVSHTGLTCAWWNAKARLESTGDLFFQNQFTWNRRPPMRSTNKDIFQVFGHTPVRKPIIEDHYANIDTGAVFGGNLTALQYPEMIVYEQENIDKSKYSEMIEQL